MTNQTNENITFKGNKQEVIGKALKVGDKLPDFKLTGVDLREITKEDFKDKFLLISVVPSIDTEVCSIQTKRFNEEIKKLGSKVQCLTVSLDLPFAQKRWCAKEGVDNLTMGSDYKNRTFGKDFGVLLQNLMLLSRAIFVSDKDSKIIHLEYVQEVTSEPDYQKALEAIKELASKDGCSCCCG